MSEPVIAPAVGQIWKDCDQRVPVRHLLVTKVDETHVTVRRIGYDERSQRVPYPRPLGKRSTKIRIDRLRPTSTGYRYITTFSPAEVKALLG